MIGYVGMTGLATGPHLHYEYLMNGVHRDPQTVKLPGADPLTADALVKFRAQTAGYLADLASPQGGAPTVAQSSAAAGGRRLHARGHTGLDRGAAHRRPASRLTADLGGDQQGSRIRFACGLLGRGNGPIRGRTARRRQLARSSRPLSPWICI